MKKKNLGVKLELFAKDFLFIGIDVVIEEIKEPGDAVKGNNDGGPGGGGLLRDLEIASPGILLEIKIEELVFHL